MGALNEYNFILDASSLEKGLGNVRRWCQEAEGRIVLRLYIPTYTLQELDFLKYKGRSFRAREALDFIDEVTGVYKDMTIEFPETLDVVLWSEVTSLVEDSRQQEMLNRLPRRFKNLLRSCVYKCHLEEDHLKWILVTEDNKIKELAGICSIPCCSLVDADSTLSKETNNKQYNETQKFNKLVHTKGTGESVVGGRKVIRTNFDNTVYASRGRGSLWRPS